MARCDEPRWNYPPVMTLGEPVTVFPTPPQCLTMSLRRWAALLLMNTVLLPILAFHLFGPQQAA